MAVKTMAVAKKISLTTGDIKRIAHLELHLAKEFLAEKLRFPVLGDNGKAHFIMYIYNNIMFATEKGILWEQIGLVVQFAHEYLKRILVDNHKLPDAIKDLAEIAHIISPLCDRHKKQYIDYLYDTVLCHYNLYKYVFLNPRDTLKTEVMETVEVPPIPPALSAGENMVIWEYNQKLKKVDLLAEQAFQERQKIKDKMSKAVTSHKTLESLSDVPLPLNEMLLKELIADVIAGQVEQKEMEMKFKIDDVISDLSFKLKKTAIPRPSVLGVPTRQKAYSFSQTGKSLSSSSIKNKERTKSGLPGNDAAK